LVGTTIIIKPGKSQRREFTFLKKVGSALHLPSSIVRDWRFWSLVVAVAALAALHSWLEPRVLDSRFEYFFFLPLTLFWAPVIFSAWMFGFAGGLVMGLWVLLVSLPDLIFWDPIPSGGYELSQIVVMVLIASFFGYLADQNRKDHQMARLYADHVTVAQEEERRRISRDIHDNILQTLMLFCRKIDSIRYFTPSLPSTANSELLELRESLEKTSLDLRDVATNLRPNVLDDLGIVDAIRQLLAEFEKNTGIEVRLEEIGAERPCTLEHQASMFRIVQEALRNVEKHSRANRIEASIKFSLCEIVFEMMDDGVGFEMPPSLSRFTSRGRFGLLGIHEQAELLGGNIKVESAPGKGTRLTASIPVFSTPIPRKS
jgi:signal transduction histidine kinase